MTLREIADEDWGWIASAMERWRPSQRWSPDGRTPSPRRIADLLSVRVSFQRAVWVAGTPVGVAQVYDVDEVSGYGRLGLLLDPDQAEETRPSLLRFVDDALRGLRLRKLCIATYEDELDVPRHLGPGATCVGRLKAHGRRDASTYVDRLVYELWRPDLAAGSFHPPTEGSLP